MSDVKRIQERTDILLITLLLLVHFTLVKWFGVGRSGRAGSESC